jgi:hypothetical protein
VVNTEGQGAINESTLTATKIWKTSASHWDKLVDTVVFWVYDVTRTSSRVTTEVRSAIRILVHNGNNTVIGLIEVNAKFN